MSWPLLLASKLEELYLEFYLEGSMVGSADDERWRLYELKFEMGPGIGMESGGHCQQHIMSLYIDNVMVRSDDPFCCRTSSLQ